MQTTLQEKQAARIAAMEIENKLEQLFTDLCGITPSIVSPENKPFASFHPKTKGEYFTILNTLKPTGDNFTVTFASGKPIPTFSPYSIHYGGLHDTMNYHDFTVKFKHDICPIWITVPVELFPQKFSVTPKTTEHLGFGRYEIKYTVSANGGTKVQHYYGENKTMYAATEEQAEELRTFIFQGN